MLGSEGFKRLAFRAGLAPLADLRLRFPPVLDGLAICLELRQGVRGLKSPGSFWVAGWDAPPCTNNP